MAVINAETPDVLQYLISESWKGYGNNTALNARCYHRQCLQLKRHVSFCVSFVFVEAIIKIMISVLIYLLIWPLAAENQCRVTS